MSDPTPSTSTPSLVRDVPAPMVLQLGQNEQQNSQSFSPSVLWQCLVKRMAVAIPLGIVLAAAGIGVLVFFTVPKFRSSALLRVTDTKPHIVYQNPGEISREFAQVQIELIKSPFIIERAIQRASLAELPELHELRDKEDPVAWIGKRLTAARLGKGDLYEVAFSTQYPQSAKKVTAAIVETYLDVHNTDAESNRSQVLQLLDEEVVIYGKKIERQREVVRELAKETGGGDGPGLAGAGPGGHGVTGPGRYTTMAALQQRMVDAEVAVTVAAKTVEAITSEINEEEKLAENPDANPLIDRLHIKESDLEEQIKKDPSIAIRQNDLRKLQLRMRALNPNSSQYDKLEKEIEKVTKDIEVKKAAAKPAVLQEIARAWMIDRKDALAVARKKLKDSEHTRDLLMTRMKEEGREQHVHGDKSLELQFAKEELDKFEEIRQRISDRNMQLTTEGRAPAQVKPLRDASLPEFEEGPSIGKKIAMVGGGMFILPSLALVGWSLLRRRVFEREQIEGEFKVKFVSEVATLPSRSVIKRPGSGRSYQRQVHMYQESINSLRATLMTDEQFKKMQVFAIASAVAAEGKTNLSSQLAMSWSQAGLEKILLVDADLRNPNVYKLFEIQSSPGLAEILRGECSIDEATVLNWGGLLSVLPAGSTPSSAAANMFSGRKFQEVLAELRKRYDKIIIDMPPTLCASEALLISKAADGTLLCARHDYSCSGQIKHAYDRLAAAGVNVIGAVLNGTPVRGYSYSYRGYAPS